LCKAFELGEYAHSRDRDAPGRYPEALLVGKDSKRLHGLVVVVQWFAHAHEDEIERSAPQAKLSGEYANLPGNFAGC
jgi:hypothetical protein